jgi:hypothetical protein
MRVLKSRRMRWGSACSMEGRKEKCINAFWMRGLTERHNLQNLGVHARII